MRKTKVLSLIVALAMLLGTMTVGVFAAEGNVAEVNGVEYTSIQSAIDAAQDNAVITLIADIDLADVEYALLDNSYETLAVVEGKTITIDMNGKTISGEYTGPNSMLVGVFSTDNNGHLTITGNGTVDVTATDKVYSLIANYEDGCTITIENGTFMLDKASDSIIYSGSSTDAAVTVKDGTFTLGNVGTGENGKPWIFNVLGSGDHHVFITGGTFNADINRQHWSNEAVVDENCYTVDNGDGTYTVKEGAVAYVNTGMTTGPYFAPKNIGYATLAEAIEAAVAASDSPVVVIKDCTMDSMVTVPAGITLTLDLNGKTVTGTDNTSKNFSLIDNRGTLTITGDGTMTLTATVNSGWNRYSAVIANNPGGKLTVNGGIIEHLGGTDMAYGIDNLTNGKGTYAETIVNSGTIKSTYRGIRQFLNGVEAQNILTVNGGTIEGANKSIWVQDPSTKANTGKLTVADNATLNGDIYLFVTKGSTEWPVEISIAAAALKDDSTVVTGNIPAGYTVAETAGTWGVTFTEDYIKWVKAELLAGRSVTLDRDIVLDDISYVESLPALSNGNGKYCGFDYGNGAFFNVIGDDVTVDLNGHSITYDIHDDAWCNKRVVSVFYVTDKANFTVTDSVGTGSVTVNGMATAVYSVASGTKATINGGTWTWNPCSTCGATNAFLYASHGGELYVTDGKFVNNVDGDAGDYMFFSHYSSKETTENWAGVDYDSTKIAISGGTFVNYNPGEIKYMDQGNGNAESMDDGCAEGFAPVDNGDGTYGVKEDTQWTTDIDAGYYMSASKKLGLMRYLFHFGGVGTIDKAGIKFIRGDKISEDMDNFVGTVEGNAKTFYGDINKIPENTEGKYYAVGFVTIGEKTYWSNPIFCEPNFTRYFSKYTGGAE